MSATAIPSVPFPAAHRKFNNAPARTQEGGIGYDYDREIKMFDVSKPPARSHRDRSIRDLTVRFLTDDAVQDIVEYALLAAFIGTVGILAWQGVRTSVGTHYTGWDSAIQTRSSCTPDP